MPDNHGLTCLILHLACHSLFLPWATRGDSGEGLQEASSFLGEQGKGPRSLSLVPFFVHSRALSKSRWKCVCVCVCVCLCFWPSHDGKNGMRGQGDGCLKIPLGIPPPERKEPPPPFWFLCFFLAVSSKSQALSWGSVSIAGGDEQERVPESGAE